MGSPFGRMTVIANPRAGRGIVERTWPQIESLFIEHDIAHDLVITEHPGHAIEAARTAIEKGSTFIVAVGGDGTVHEVVNGMMGETAPLVPDAVLGVIPAGTGCDFVRTFGLPQDPLAAARHLLGDNLWGRLDIGRARCATPLGGTTARWFVNVGQAGLGAATAERASRMPRSLGPIVYKLAALREIITMKPVQARIAMHGRKARGTRVDAPLEEIAFEGLVDLVIVANCQFFGGGLKVAPRAIPEDQMLDVLVARVGRRAAITLMQKMNNGAHVPNPAVPEFLADRIEITTERPIAVEVDGESIGRTPVTFDLLPAAIALKI